MGERVPYGNRFNTMTYDEFCDNVIIPAYERLIEEHSAKGAADTGEILPSQGSTLRLQLTIAHDEHPSEFLIHVSDVNHDTGSVMGIASLGKTGKQIGPFFYDVDAFSEDTLTYLLEEMHAEVNDMKKLHRVR